MSQQACPGGVIFDMDGVLVDSYEAHWQSWQRLAAEQGKTITEKQYAATFGKVSRDIIAELFGVTDPPEVKRIDQRKEEIYRDLIRGNLPVMPGAVELIRSLHGAGFRLGIGSSGPPENVDLACREMGVDELLDAKVTGRDVQRGKPDPQVFLVSAERLGFLPSQCVVIEDAPVGLDAARRGGMKCVALVGTHPAEKLTAADLVIRHLNELGPDMIARLLSDENDDERH